VDSLDLLSRDQWEAWQRQEETQQFKEFLKVQVAEAKAAWASGQFTNHQDMTQIAVANLAAVENVQFAERIINLEYEDYLTAMKG